MAQLGIGAMIHYMGGGYEHNADEYYGKQITRAALDDNRVNIDFSDGTKISIWDDGQSCCEYRHITCDDMLSDLVGGTLTKIEVTESGNEEGEWDTHEWCFIEIATDKDHIKFTTHNEHNGYYSGFGLTITERE